MPEYARVVTFDADEAALNALVADISSADGPPADIPATKIAVLADREAGKIVVATRFASEADLQRGSATLEAMSPSGDNIRRTAVNIYEVVLEREA